MLTEFTLGMILPAKDSASDLTKLDSDKPNKVSDVIIDNVSVKLWRHKSHTVSTFLCNQLKSIL